jgi:hypothetical protein
MIADDLWDRIRCDFEKLILPLNDRSVVLAGGLCTGPPEISNGVIRFNGPQECGGFQLRFGGGIGHGVSG